MVYVISGLYLRSSGVGGVSRMRWNATCACFPELGLRLHSYQSGEERWATVLLFIDFFGDYFIIMCNGGSVDKNVPSLQGGYNKKNLILLF